MHKELSECLEFNSFTVLYETQKALLESPLMALSIPKNPTLPNLLLISTQDNSLTMFLGSTLRQFQVGNVETLCGLYLIAYRLLRVSFYPSHKLSLVSSLRQRHRRAKRRASQPY